MWRCPLCQQPLQQNERSWRCENRHTFDEAKSGYLNLLPVQQKKSKQPGDDKTMLNARRRFHDAAGYKPLMTELAGIMLQYAPKLPVINLYDAGCGEGSYLGFLTDRLSESGMKVQAAGSDIAKHAVDLAAKRYKACRFAVASSVSLPLPDASQHIMLQVFAPGSDSEYQRLIAPGGLLMTVDPAQNHLWSVKQAIYANPRPHEVRSNEKAGFTHLVSKRVSFNVSLANEQTRLALLEMTPYYWRIPKEKAVETFVHIQEVEADFAVQVWQRDCR